MSQRLSQGLYQAYSHSDVTKAVTRAISGIRTLMSQRLSQGLYQAYSHSDVTKAVTRAISGIQSL